jgi:hypothetical protein
MVLSRPQTIVLTPVATRWRHLAILQKARQFRYRRQPNPASFLCRPRLTYRRFLYQEVCSHQHSKLLHRESEMLEPDQLMQDCPSYCVFLLLDVLGVGF